MTKQHFIALAAQIKLIVDEHARREAATAVSYVALRFNSRFDTARFYAACGLE